MGKEGPKLSEQSKLPSEEETEKRSTARDRRFRQQSPALLGLAVFYANVWIVNDIPIILPQAAIVVLDLVPIYWLATRHR